MGFNSAFKGLKLFKKTGNGRLNNLNDPNRPQCVKNECGYTSTVPICLCGVDTDDLIFVP